jgi:hypothetical protein
MTGRCNAKKPFSLVCLASRSSTSTMASQPPAGYPATRKAWQYNRAGSMPEILEQKTLLVPSVPTDGHLIRVAAVGLNPTDYKNVEPGGPTFAIHMPVIPCSDFSGVVVGGPQDGLEVYGHIPTEQTLLWHVRPNLSVCTGAVALTNVRTYVWGRVRARSRSTSSLRRRSCYRSRRT